MHTAPFSLFASILGVAAAAAAQIPLVFEPAAANTFVARLPGLQVRIDGRGAELGLANGRRLAIECGGEALVRAEEPLPGRSHYLLGDDPAAWRRDVQHAAKVRCASAWPGVDVVWYGRNGALEYDLVFTPGADPARAGIRFSGADRVARRDDGAVVVTIGELEVVQRPPYAYQLIGGERREVAVEVHAAGDTITFVPREHDARRELVIDPVLAYATYLGGNGADAVHAMATDAAGNVYLTGLTTSANFPLQNPLQPAIAGLYDYFVTKLDPTGTSIVWSTFVGGNSGGFGTDEWPVALAVGPSGEVAVLGRTESANFPVVNAVQPALAGGVDALVFVLNPSGSQLVWSTYLGGTGHELDRDNTIGGTNGGVAIDGAGNVFVAGTTHSANFPTANAVHPGPLGNPDVFVARFAPNGTRLYASYFGGNGFDELLAVSPSVAGRVLLNGTTTDGFPTTPGVYAAAGSGFVVDLDVLSQTVVWSTRFPTGIADAALDASGAVYVVGATSLGGAGVPTTMGAHQVDHGGSFSGHGVQAFAAKLTPGAAQLVWATYYGSPVANESFSDAAVDGFGQLWAGGTTSEHFGTPSNAALLVQFNSEGSSVVHDFGIARNSTGRDLLLLAPGEAWLTGDTWATAGIATPGALQFTHGGNRDGFLARSVAPAAIVRELKFPVDRLTSSDARTGTVTLDGAAPSGGATIVLQSSSPAVTVPATVFVPAGSATALVPITSARVQATQNVTITATWNGSTGAAALRLWPGPLYRAVPIVVPGPNGTSTGLDIDAFGTVVGTTGYEAFRWHDATGPVVLGPGEAHGIGDGGAITGGNGAQAMRWTLAGAQQPLGALQPGMFSIGYDADPNGRVVGFSDFTSGGISGRRAFLWSPAGGMQNLGTLGGDASVAYAINRTGTVVGSAALASAYEHPFAWSPASGLVDLGLLPGFTNGAALDVNDAGQVVGIQFQQSTLRAFRFTPGAGMQDLGMLPGDTSSGARGLNAFGWTVGWSSPTQPNLGEAMRHVDATMQALRDELSAEDAFRWQLVAGEAINDAGQIAGTGVLRGNGNGDTAFRLDPNLLRPFGRGCAGLGGRVTALAGDRHPAAGNTITLHVSGRPSSIALLALGTGPGAVTLPGGCEVHLAAIANSVAFLLDAAGTATFSLPLPATLAPQSFHMQAAVIDAAAANTVFTTSNGLELRVL